ncbi:dihydrofolate reductase [Kordia sp. YSTF-M3]|uniref:Dihydrofolate reductase n=1 Tax=Kordia aestuariivivens TaxID=2759037 RepID=A0ABR7QH55_9FLAO|nr:dihydrofolate reductase family protein [Kordia aestuariivivens]MBC8757686.1 dihydrofolate reductase [Kordia aestuariivivens]
MRKLILHIAISLDGKIARLNGDVDWLDAIPHKEGVDYGFYEMYNSIDTTIQGNKTYQKVLSWDVPFPYKDKENYVFTTNSELKNNEDVSFIAKDHIQFVKDLKQKNGKDIWLIGGGQINALLLKANLIDELQIFIMPIVIPEGIPLFGELSYDQQFELSATESYESGVVGLVYKPRA